MVRLLGNYLKENIRSICLYLGLAGIFFVVFDLYQIDTDAVNYAFLLSGICILLYGGLGFMKYVNRHKRLLEAECRVLSDPDSIPEAAGLIEADYQRLLKNIFDDRQELESANRISRQELKDYYVMWVHQVKTPIAALRVLLQASEELENENARKLTREMKLELFKIEQYVEMVLTYLRMESMSSDLTFEFYSIDSIIRQAVKKYSRVFILQKIKLNYTPVEKMVLTDEKWLEFVLEQLLSNALKYTVAKNSAAKSSGENTEQNTISVYVEDSFLVVQDAGIGIYPEDLPRVFEKGFTGYNGRSNKKSTGIGLYLCKSILDKLEHEIRIESEPGVGTKVFIGLERPGLKIE